MRALAGLFSIALVACGNAAPPPAAPAASTTTTAAGPPIEPAAVTAAVRKALDLTASDRSA
jgi:hypothetical protein